VDNASHGTNTPQNKTGTYALVGCLGCAGLLLLVIVIVGTIAVIGSSSSNNSSVTNPTSVASSDPGGASSSSAPTAQPSTEEKKGESPKATHSSNNKKTRSVTIEVTASGSGQVSYGGSGSHNTAKFEDSWSHTEEIGKSDYYTVSVSGDIFSSDDSQVVSCKLLIDGKVKSEKSATGKYGHAFCSTF